MAANPLSTDCFPNTRWSLVLTAQQGGEAQASKALSELFELYWFPVYGYVRRQGNGPEDAEDLTQGFFESIIRRDSLMNTEASQGKLRAFLLASLKNFLIDQHRQRTAAKRGGEAGVYTMNYEDAEARLEQEALDHDSPDFLFERSWAQTLLQDVMKRLRASYERAKKLPMFEAMSPCLLQDETPEYRGLSKQLGSTVVALRIQYHRMKQRYGELLEEEIRHTVSNEEEAQEEREFLLKVLGSV